MQVKRVLLEYPAHENPPDNLLITFPSQKKRRKVGGDEFDTLKDRLPLSFVRKDQVDDLDTILVKQAGGTATGGEPANKKRDPPKTNNLVQASEAVAKHLLRDTQTQAGSLDQQFERQLLRAADDDLFDQIVLPLISVQLHVRGFTPKKDAMVLYTVETLQDSSEHQDDESEPVSRHKRRAPEHIQRSVRAYSGRIKVWSYELATEIGSTLDNNWFRNARQDAVKQLGNTPSSVIVVDAPLVGWWEVLPDANLVVSTRRNVDIATSEGIAPNNQDGSYYDQYKDIDNMEYSGKVILGKIGWGGCRENVPVYSDADSVDYGQSDSDDFREAYIDDSDAEDDSVTSRTSSSSGNRYDEYLS